MKMEIKVGQWARGYCFETCVEKTVIGEIILINYEYPEAIKVSNKDGEYWLINITQIKTSDNLEDLLEVEDIVHFDYWFEHLFYTSNNYWKKAMEILNENTLDNFKQDIKDGHLKIKITAIELAENRKPQKIGSGSE